MNESETLRLLSETETTLRNFDGKNLFTQQVRSFSDLIRDLPQSDLSKSVLSILRDQCVPLLEEHTQSLGSATWAKLHFALGRINFLLNDQRKGRGHFLNAGRHGMPETVVFYNIAMTYAVDLSLESDERKQHTIASLRMVMNVDERSAPGMEAALHIKLIEMSHSF
jgi:hypothetical protein